MLLYRITKTDFSEDLTGEGAFRYGGRWSPRGVRIIHTSETVSQACMEVLVHVSNKKQLSKMNMSLVTYELDEKASVMELDTRILNGDWNKSPDPRELRIIGEQWVSEKTSLGLRVPSAAVLLSSEMNILINPIHPEFNDYFKLLEIAPYSFDTRLLS